MNVLALHGFLGDRDDWNAFQARANYRLSQLEFDRADLPGHGVAPAPVPADFDGWVAWVRARLAARTGPVHLVGYSLGGRLALAAAAAERGSGRVASLAAFAASPGLADPAERSARLAADRRLADTLERDGLAEFLRGWYAQALFAPAVETVGRERLIARRSLGEAASLAAALRTASQGAMPDLRSRLASLDVPALVLAGDRDHRYLGIGAETAVVVPRGRFVAVSDAGHSLLLEAPERCADLWCVFLESTVQPKGPST
ncbi:MAG TPA: alpha/beta fold hydrolase [Candidatus Krumholzibacteria bacterium]|nr:alpha/beta fold hydrolase [Candidatus Krumholzibacteria bacterium]HPD70302.1 alpha/beta fold hydrolase [Candidatus Krumholzibacteria bacterium]HRY39998.1 alpha/beta fold hydrolase [Candidatus Krumholzibacteria bacterium]